MKDYLVHANDHSMEISCVSFNQAKREASSLNRLGEKEIAIDQYEDQELTGTYWRYVGGKLTKES